MKKLVKKVAPWLVVVLCVAAGARASDPPTKREVKADTSARFAIAELQRRTAELEKKRRELAEDTAAIYSEICARHGVQPYERLVGFDPERGVLMVDVAPSASN